MLKHAIILPLKESFTVKKSGAVSIWVNDYLRQSKTKKKIIILCAENDEKNDKYLTKLVTFLPYHFGFCHLNLINKI